MSALHTVTLPDLARWIEARLDLTLGFVIPEPVGYGVTIVDPGLLHDPEAPAARLCALGDGVDGDFDALAMVINQWITIDDTHRGPGDFGQRRRARVVIVSCEGGRASVSRWEHEPSTAVVGE
jgi:hypothetical protein